MKYNFQEYARLKELAKFNLKFEQLCYEIALSELKFEDYWVHHVVPVLTESISYEKDDQLFVEFGWNPLKWFGNKSAENPASTPTPTPVQQTELPQIDQTPQMSPQQLQKMQNFQAKVDQQIGNIKQRFQVAMRDFLKSVTDEAKSQNDPHLWQIAKSFYKKIVDSAQPVVQDFTMKAKIGKGSYQDKYDQEYSSYQNEKLKNLKQKLSNPQTRSQLQATRAKQNGVDMNDPAFKAMQQKMAQGYNPFNDFNKNQTTYGTPVQRLPQQA